ncbi:MAG: GAF domain-containing protein [Dehalococcoidia bacterium]
MAAGFARLLRDALHADLAVVRRRYQDEVRFEGGAGEIPDDVRNYIVAISCIFARGPDDSRLPFAVADTSELPKDSGLGPIGDYARSLVYAPLFVADELQGTLCVASRALRGYSADEVALVEIVGSIVAAGFASTTRLQTLEEQQRRSRGLVEVMAAATGAQSLNETLREICSVVAGISVVQRCSILLYDVDKERLVPVMSAGQEDPELWKRFRGSTPRAMDESIWREAVASRRPVIAEDALALASDDPNWRELVHTFAIKSLAAFPLYAGNRFLGMMVGDTFSRPVVFAAEEVEFLSSIAGQVGALIEHAQLQDLLREQATTDPLTHLYNRRYVEERLASEIGRTQRAGEASPCSWSTSTT